MQKLQTHMSSVSQAFGMHHISQQQMHSWRYAQASLAAISYRAVGATLLVIFFPKKIGIMC
jgi:hypothetical protein